MWILGLKGFIGHLPSRPSQHTTNSTKGYLPGGRRDLQHSPKNFHPLRKHQQLAEKKERIATATNHFLSSESDICLLLHFGCRVVHVNDQTFKCLQTFQSLPLADFPPKKYVQEEGESNSSKIWFECIT